MPRFLFSCAPASLLEGLAGGSHGMAGLRQTQIALPSQFAVAFSFRRKFALCLSSSASGVMFFSDGPYVLLPNVNASDSLTYTPLLGSRNRDLCLFLPVISGVMGLTPRREAQESPDGNRQDPETGSSELVVLINPFTQGMIVIDRGVANFEALIRGLSEMESGKSGPPPASNASIEAMPATQVCEEGEECSICLEEMEVGEEAKEMPCKHRFHGKCIRKWLGLHGSCPVCRCQMPVEEGEDVKKEKEKEGLGEATGKYGLAFLWEEGSQFLKPNNQRLMMIVPISFDFGRTCPSASPTAGGIGEEAAKRGSSISDRGLRINIPSDGPDSTRVNKRWIACGLINFCLQLA